MRYLLLFWNTVFLLCVSLTYAQQKRHITGVVQDETGLELPGASVVIKGTTVLNIKTGDCILELTVFGAV